MYLKLEGLLLISHLPSLRSGGRLVLLSSRKKYYNPLDFLSFLEWMLPAVTIESGYIVYIATNIVCNRNMFSCIYSQIL